MSITGIIMGMFDIKNNLNTRDIINNIEYYADLFLSQGILIFKGLNPTKKEEMDLMYALQKYTGWFTDFACHDEDHELTFRIYGDFLLSKEELFIPWHIENVRKENYQTGALWHMLKYDCDSDCGQTGFVNMVDVFSTMPDSWKEFLLSCKVSTLGELSSDYVKQRNIVIPHNVTKKLIYRPNFFVNVEALTSVADTVPLDEDIVLYNHIVDWTKKQVCHSPSNQFWFKWEVGDTIIIDLLVMAHAVRGGFNLGQRSFSRIWAYKNNLEYFVAPSDIGD
jgi:alpha-ketoglutarate-dependent taurine dioxygenase